MLLSGVEGFMVMMKDEMVEIMVLSMLFYALAHAVEARTGPSGLRMRVPNHRGGQILFKC
jgi:hypothetical protein